MIREILQEYYEPQFSRHSHGFRPKRGCHTALTEVTTQWTGTKWFIEGDITGCFDNIHHETLLAILSEKLHDNRFLRLIRNLLQAGYLEDWRYNATLSGTPQGGVVSPILANIYLDRLDTYVEQVLLPEHTTKTAKRRYNKPYEALRMQITRKRKQGKVEEAQKLMVQLQQMPSVEPNDPSFRRLRYVRYADDWLVGYIGPKNEAEEIKEKSGKLLRETLHLELSQQKTLITNATSEAARFLGYEIKSQQANDKHCKGRRCVNGVISLYVPKEVIEKKCARYTQQGKPAARGELILDEDFSIISRYQAEYRGVVQYYLLAQNVSWLWRLHWKMKTSLLKTLAGKHKVRLMTMLRKYQTTVETPQGRMKCLRMERERTGKKALVAQFGGIPLQQQKKAVLEDRSPFISFRKERNELVRRLLANTWELCGSKELIEVHHIRKMADLEKKGRNEKPEWIKRMAARRRKTLIVCRRCHNEIHAGRSQQTRNTSLESRVI